MIFSYQEYLLTCIGGTLTHNLFGDFQLSRMHIDMHWWDFTTKSFWRLSVIKNTYSHSLMGPKLKFFRRLSAIKNTYWHALVWPEHKIVSALFSCQEHLLRCIGGTLTQNLFGEFNPSKMHIDMHWWNFTTKYFRRFSAIKITYGCALVGP